ncbi:MAG: SH3 domain-containing protein, partial [Pseudomonadota bacterium]
DEPAEIELAEAPIASHVVERSLVNARSGPSLEDAVEAQIAGGVALQLLEEDRRWGRFRVLDGDQTGLEAWIAFSVVTAR